MITKVIELAYFPDGLDPDTDYDAMTFCVKVQWRGSDRYAVLGRGSNDLQLSRAGNWKWCPLPMQRRQYRHSYEEACAWAEKVVNTQVVNGMTWKQWQDWTNKKETTS